MFNRLANYFNNKLLKDIKLTSFSSFGVEANDDFDMINILKHTKKFNSRLELQAELNKLANYIYEGERTIFFHEFRQFPYINHGKENPSDLSGFAKNYTSSDIYLIKFIKRFLRFKSGKYLFFDVDYIIQNTKKVALRECSIDDMPIDEILR